ncbi:MAG: Wzz/FepE/Etk N-terminal domain-containing protein [Bryobacteraceae bacterium]
MDQLSTSDAGVDAPLLARKLYYTLRERLWIIAACLALGLALAGFYIWWTPTTFAAVTIIEVNQTTKSATTMENSGVEDLTKTELLNTIERNLGSVVVMRRVVQSLHLTAESLGLPKLADRDYTETELAWALQGQVIAELERGTRLIDVTAENTNAELAQKFRQRS